MMRALISTAILALTMGPIGSAWGQSNMEVIGHIKATLDGDSREWQTFKSRADGRTVGSANWQRMTFTMPDMSDFFATMAGSMTPEQRAQLEAMTGSDSPMAQAMAQMAGQQVGNPDIITLSISGMDPDSPHKMREQVLAIDVDLDDSDNAEGVTMPADVTYVIDASGGVMSQVLYVSDYGENDATVTFDKLDLQSGGGHASGQFSAKMCKLDMKRIMDGPDLSDCVQVEGTFDTALVEETPRS